MSTQHATDAPLSIQPVISRNVRALLIAADWDQGDLSHATGLSEPQISRKMKNRGSSWTPDDLTVIADALSGRLSITVDPGSFFRPLEQALGHHRKLMNGPDLRLVHGGGKTTGARAMLVSTAKRTE